MKLMLYNELYVQQNEFLENVLNTGFFMTECVSHVFGLALVVFQFGR